MGSTNKEKENILRNQTNFGGEAYNEWTEEFERASGTDWTKQKKRISELKDRALKIMQSDE